MNQSSCGCAELTRLVKSGRIVFTALLVKPTHWLILHRRATYKQVRSLKVASWSTVSSSSTFLILIQRQNHHKSLQSKSIMRWILHCKSNLIMLCPCQWRSNDPSITNWTIIKMTHQVGHKIYYHQTAAMLSSPRAMSTTMHTTRCSTICLVSRSTTIQFCTSQRHLMIKQCTCRQALYRLGSVFANISQGSKGTTKRST